MTADERREQAKRWAAGRQPYASQSPDWEIGFIQGWEAQVQEINALTALLWEFHDVAMDERYTFNSEKAARFHAVRERVREALNESDHVEP